MARKLWIKICGLTTREAVAAALDAEVDAIGFVFAESVRRIEPALAHRLAAPARGRALVVAVMRHPSQTWVDTVLQDFQPDVLQTDQADWDVLQTPANVQRLPVFRSTDTVLPQGGRFLVEGPASGTGTVTDWGQARHLAQLGELVLAGGLNPGNVGAALRAVAPHGVDVSSGVESSPGIKSVDRILAFVSAARAA